MKATLRVLAATVMTAAAFGSASAQAPAAAGLTGELIRATAQVEQKLDGLGNALSQEHFGWRPGPNVRSSGEVLLHIAADNYFMPAALGHAAPAATKINATDFAAMTAFEKQTLDKAATLAEMKTSFDHLRKFMATVPESRMSEKVKIFGQEFTVREFLVMTVTHLSEHLGQMIAYARSNNVTPPWSK